MTEEKEKIDKEILAGALLAKSLTNYGEAAKMKYLFNNHGGDKPSPQKPEEIARAMATAQFEGFQTITAIAVTSLIALSVEDIPVDRRADVLKTYQDKNVANSLVEMFGTIFNTALKKTIEDFSEFDKNQEEGQCQPV